MRKKRRSAIAIMGRLIGLVKPLLHIMVAAIVLGTAGFLCAIFLTILAAQVIVKGLALGVFEHSVVLQGDVFFDAPVKVLLGGMILLAVLRGVLHYAEQYCNHYIAFKLLAIIRHKVFAALRRLCPAKLEGRDKGNLISIITTDIELLEVFYAHTISPIAIAVLTSAVLVVFLGQYHVLTGVLALAAYLVVGVVIPVWNGRRGGEKGMEFRTAFGELNSFVLDSLRGLDETIQYGQGEQRKKEICERSKWLSRQQAFLNKLEGAQRSVTNLVILLSSFSMLALTLWLYEKGQLGFDGILTCTVAMMGSFGPVVALSNLSNNLHQTLASGERVLSLLEEKPLVEEVTVSDTKTLEEDIASGEMLRKQAFAGANLEQVFFRYPENPELGCQKNEETRCCAGADTEWILKDYSLELMPGKITGIFGASGSGKSTILKLLMRFWDADAGNVAVNKTNVKELPTEALRKMESYVTQETYLFHDTIANNIGLAKPGASMEDIEAAAKKASIHEFIRSLPKGYETEVGELGDTLSGGEKQRIGLARAFLHDAPLLLLDEPTSNLDSLNEGIILKSLQESSDGKTIVLVSHRASTMGIADVVYQMDRGRVS